MDKKNVKEQRSRYIQLTQIAVDLLSWLDDKKVTISERCIVRRIAEDLSNQEACVFHEPPTYVGLATATTSTGVNT